MHTQPGADNAGIIWTNLGSPGRTPSSGIDEPLPATPACQGRRPGGHDHGGVSPGHGTPNPKRHVHAGSSCKLAMITEVPPVGHGAPSPKWPPRALPRRLPRLFTATVATDRDKPDGRCPASVKSGRAAPLGRHERLLIMAVPPVEVGVCHDLGARAAAQRRSGAQRDVADAAGRWSATGRVRRWQIVGHRPSA